MRLLNATMMIGTLLALHATGCAAGKGGAGEARFSSHLPSDRTLASLSGAERKMLCADQAAFLTQPSFRKDACRLSAILAAGFATLSASVTESELRLACSNAYSDCLNAAPSATMCSSSAPESTACTATVAEVTACFNDSAMQAHLLASDIPDCDSLSTADIMKQPASTTGASMTVTGSSTSSATVHSCDVVAAKCPDSASGTGGSAAPMVLAPGQRLGPTATGQLDGESVTAAGDFASIGPTADGHFTIDLSLGDDGWVYLTGSGDSSSDQLKRIDSALLHPPSSWPHAGEYLCVGDGSFQMASDGASVLTLGQISSLGACPQVGGTGSLSWSYDGSLAVPPVMPSSGTMPTAILSLGDQLWNGTANGFVRSQSLVRLSMWFAERTGFVTFGSDSLPTGPDPAPVTNGALILQPSSAEPLQLSCLGAESTILWPDTESASAPAPTGASSVTIALEGRGLSPLRACPGDPVGGEIEIRGLNSTQGASAPAGPAAPPPPATPPPLPQPMM